ncbi:MAG: hypothetical protein ACP5HM_08705 [Anaerolineae bacterium]
MFSALDVFLVLVGAVFLAWGFYRQTVGMLITWFGFYLSVLLGGLVALFIGGAHDFAVTVARWLGGTTQSIGMVEVGFFFFTFVGFWIIYHLLFDLAFKGEAYPSFGLVDGFLGGVLGLGLSVPLSAVLVNLWRVSAGMAWQPENLRQWMYAIYQVSVLPPRLMPVLRILNLFLPFSFARPPLPLSPWG